MPTAVASTDTPKSANRLLESLSPSDFAKLAPHLRVAQLRQDNGLPIRGFAGEAIFPQTCVLSLMGTTADGLTLDVAKIGAEGYASSHSVDETSFSHFVRHSGAALCVEMEALRRIRESSPSFACAMATYHEAFARQIAEMAMCSAVHCIRERCIHTLLLLHDRVHGSIELSHELLASMVGVRRASISVVMHDLRLSGLIGYRRGNIEIVDRRALVAAACSCYREPVAFVLSKKDDGQFVVLPGKLDAVR